MMSPEQTYAVTIGEVARSLERIDDGQKVIIARLDAQPSQYVTRNEWNMLVKDLTQRRVPWTNVATAITAIAAIVISLLR